jgi:hypothetical protein
MQAPLDPGFEATQVLSFALGSAFCNGFAGRQRRLRIGQQRLLGAEHAQQSLEHVAHHESRVDRRGLVDLGHRIVVEDQQLGDGRIVVTERRWIAGRQRNTELVAVVHVLLMPRDPIVRLPPAIGIRAQQQPWR